MPPKHLDSHFPNLGICDVRTNLVAGIYDEEAKKCHGFLIEPIAFSESRWMNPLKMFLYFHLTPSVPIFTPYM